MGTTNLTKILQSECKFSVDNTDAKNYRIEIPDCVIKTSGRYDFISNVRINIPAAFASKVRARDHAALFAKLYGQESADKIAASVFHRAKNHNYGMLTGEYKFVNDVLCFDVNPMVETGNANSILFYSDASLVGYAGNEGLTCFTHKPSKLCGVILSFNQLEREQVFAGRSMRSVRTNMENNVLRLLRD